MSRENVDLPRADSLLVLVYFELQYKKSKAWTDRTVGRFHAGKEDMRTVRWLVITGLFVMVVGETGGLGATEPVCLSEPKEALQCMPGPKTLEERLEELEQKQQVADRLRELDEQREAQGAKEAPVVGADQDGFFLRSANRAFELRFGGYAQVDGRFFFGNTAQSNVTDSFEVRRFRPILRGTLNRYISFKLMPDFGQGQVRLIDGFYRLRLLACTPVACGEIQTAGGFGKASVQRRLGVCRARSARESRSEPGYWGATLW